MNDNLPKIREEYEENQTNHQPDVAGNNFDNNRLNENQNNSVDFNNNNYNQLGNTIDDKQTNQQDNQQNNQIIEPQQESAATLVKFAIINAIIIVVCNILVTRGIKYGIFAIPILIIVFTIATASKYKEKNDYPTSVLLSGVFSGIVMFIISIVSKDVELYTHLAIVCAASGIIGYLISAVTNSLLSSKEKTGVQILGGLLFYALIVAGPLYLYKTKPNFINQYVFYNKTEIIAKTENEYITETLKVRYGIKFVCGEEISKVKGYEDNTEVVKVKSQIDQDNKLLTTRTCIDENANEFQVTSIEYNKSKVQYIVQDQYLEETKLAQEKNELIEMIKDVTGASQVKVFLYPQKNCHFIGDCISTSDYFEIYEEENDFNKMFEASKVIDLRKYVSLEPKELINEYQFKYQIFVYGKYLDRVQSDLMDMIQKILDKLNEKGYKNTFGYEVIVLDVTNKELQQKLISVYGQSNDSKSFTNPVIENKKEDK